MKTNGANEFSTFPSFPNYNGIRPTNNNIYIYTYTRVRVRIYSVGTSTIKVMGNGATERNAVRDEEIRGEGMAKRCRRFEACEEGRFLFLTSPEKRRCLFLSFLPPFFLSFSRACVII